jgi:hypothetical protein
MRYFNDFIFNDSIHRHGFFDTISVNGDFMGTYYTTQNILTSPLSYELHMNASVINSAIYIDTFTTRTNTMFWTNWLDDFFVFGSADVKNVTDVLEYQFFESGVSSPNMILRQQVYSTQNATHYEYHLDYPVGATWVEATGCKLAHNKSEGHKWVWLKVYINVDDDTYDSYVAFQGGSWLQCVDDGNLFVDADSPDFIGVQTSGGDAEAVYVDFIASSEESINCTGNSDPQITSIYRDTGNPVCVNSTVIFTVRSYDVDSTQLYRVLTDCDGDGSTDYTSFWYNCYPANCDIITECTYNTTGVFLSSFVLTDECFGSDSDTESVSVTTSSCYGSGEGGGDIDADEPLSDVASGWNISITDDTDGYSSSYFDMSTCSDWTEGWRALLWWLCPIISLAIAILSTLFNAIFSSYFGIFLLIVLIIMLIVVVRRRR